MWKALVGRCRSAGSWHRATVSHPAIQSAIAQRMSFRFILVIMMLTGLGGECFLMQGFGWKSLAALGTSIPFLPLAWLIHASRAAIFGSIGGQAWVILHQMIAGTRVE